MQVRATQLQDASAQLEALRARSRELRLRTSDLQAREQQLRESRYQTPVGPERARLDRQWLDVRHDATAASLELEAVTERMQEVRAAREQARVIAVPPPRAAEPPPAVEVPGLANVGSALLLLFLAPIVVLLVHRFLTRGSSRDASGLETSARFQRLEQSIESIAMDVERIAEGQRFVTRILAERHQEAAPRVQATPAQDTDALGPH